MLKPGGWAVLQVPLSLALDHTLEDPQVITPEERARIFGQRDHVRIYARQDYRRRLEGAGFQVQVTTPREIAGQASPRLAWPMTKICIAPSNHGPRVPNPSRSRRGTKLSWLRTSQF
jgi:hypothetical protein